MADSLWQQLFDAVKVRFQGIRTANGYQTDLGANCYAWRDLGRSPFTVAEMPCHMIRDPRRIVDPEHQTIQRHYFILNMEVFAAAMASTSSPPDNFARRMISDMDRALGLEASGGRRWNVNGTDLALDTLLDTDEIEAAHAGDRIVHVRKTFAIRFKTGLFNPYAQ